LRILLVRPRQIGDVVFTTPAIHALRRRFPDAQLSYIVEPAAAPVVLNNPNLNDVIVAPRARGLSGLLADVALGRRLKAARYDVAIDFHGGPRASLLTWLSGAPVRIGYEIAGRGWMYTRRIARPRELRRRHSVENQWDFRFARHRAPTRSIDPVEMPADGTATAAVEARLRQCGVHLDDPIVVVHVSAGNPFRRWPIEHFVALIVKLASDEPRRRFVVTSGPSEGDAASRVIADARSALGEDAAARVVSCGEFSLAELRALFDRAALYIGGDSGPLHIAATTQVPIVGLPGRRCAVRPFALAVTTPTSRSMSAGAPAELCDQRSALLAFPVPDADSAQPGLRGLRQSHPWTEQTSCG
jgi:ADP-heptose:LPS heptosyltransferase